MTCSAIQYVIILISLTAVFAAGGCESTQSNQALGSLTISDFADRYGPSDHLIPTDRDTIIAWWYLPQNSLPFRVAKVEYAATSGEVFRYDVYHEKPSLETDVLLSIHQSLESGHRVAVHELRGKLGCEYRSYRLPTNRYRLNWGTGGFVLGVDLDQNGEFGVNATLTRSYVLNE